MTGERRRWTKRAAIAIAAVAVVPMLGWGYAASAAETPGTRAASTTFHGARHSIVGSWRITATATEPVAATAHVLLTAIPGGGLVETRLLAKPPIPGIVDFATLETPGHGAWAATGRRTYDVLFVYFIQTAEGSDLLATETVRWSATVSKDGSTISGPATSEVRLVDGTLAAAWSFTTSGTRIVP